MSMNYELAKQLYDAGFPIPELGDAKGYLLQHFTGTGDLMYTPTLSELIEACGSVFQGVSKVGDRWCATAQLSIQIAEQGGNNYPSLGGDTPEEAVANLWLALNKK